MDDLHSTAPPATQPPDPTAPLSPMLAADGETPEHPAPATRRAYRADWNHFLTWCREAGWAALPASPHTVAAYLAAMATTHTSSVLERRLATLSRAHRLAGLDWPRAHPAIRNTLRGIQREHARPKQQAAALATDELIRLVETCETRRGSKSAYVDGPVGVKRQ